MTAKATYKIKNPTDFANALLGELGLPDTKTNVQNVVGWETAEGGNWNNTAVDNPLNASQPEPNSTNFNGGNGPGVQAYPNWQEGLNATVSTLQAGNDGYPQILTALNTSQPWLNFATAVQNSSWDKNHYGYSLTTDNPSSTAGATNPNAYNQGVTYGQQDGSVANSPSTTSGDKKLTGMAGILQELNLLYNPNPPSGNTSWWNPLTDLSNIGNSVGDTMILVFVRGTSAILSIGLVVIGITTMLHGSSAGGSSASNVLEFVNNAKVTQQRTELTQARIQSRREHEQNVSARSEARIRSNAEREAAKAQAAREREEMRANIAREREASKNSRSNRWANIHEEYTTRPRKK